MVRHILIQTNDEQTKFNDLIDKYSAGNNFKKFLKSLPY